MKKINVAELLKGCPSGMELDCTLYEDVYFDWVDELNIIHCYIQHETHKTSITFNQHGTPNSDIKSKCVIFPKGKTSWEGFVPPCQFKDGDIIFSQYYDSKYIAIVKTIDKSNDIHVHCLYDYTYDTFATNKILGRLENSLEIRFAKEEEKQKLFETIKANGYKWNQETKTLESKFKDGDVITCNNIACTFVSIFKDKPTEKSFREHCSVILDNNKFIVGIKYADYANPRFATEEEKIKLFDSIKANGYNWNSKTKTLEKLIESKFKDGDILYIYSANPWICIYKEGGEKENVYYKHVAITSSSFVYDRSPLCHRNHVNEIRHATEEEKIKLFQAIKDNGYKWNAGTKTLEELVEPKFNVGDSIVDTFRKCMGSDSSTGRISQITDDKYIFTDGSYIYIKNQDNWELVPNKLVEPNFKVGDTITNGKTSITIGYIDNEYYYEISRNIASRLFIKFQDEWNLVPKLGTVPNKFDINTLVPFETRVLVRNEDNNIWKPAIFGYYAKDKNAPYYIVGGTCWSQCIPYEYNKHLLGKTDDCDEFYK